MTGDLRIRIDGVEMTALLDTGFDDSVMNAARKLKQVQTAWEEANIGTAAGYVITPTGTCTASGNIRGVPYTVSSVILLNCRRDVILGMDFLMRTDAVIDFASGVMSFEIPECAECTQDNADRLTLVTPSNRNETRVATASSQRLDLPPMSSVFIFCHESHYARRMVSS